MTVIFTNDAMSIYYVVSNIFGKLVAIIVPKCCMQKWHNPIVQFIKTIEK